MKANELMIGDWVCCTDPTPFKIEAITIIDTPEYVTGSDGFDVEIADLQPIPLTWDILYKNFPDTDDGLEWWENTEFENDAKDEYLWWHITVTGDVLVVNGEIRYVHELQHALRLCGIEKEIEL